MRTRIEYESNEDYDHHYVGLTVTSTESEKDFYLFVAFAQRYNFSVSGCPAEFENEYYDSFSMDKYMSKKDFMQEFRACVKEWKQSIK